MHIVHNTWLTNSYYLFLLCRYLLLYFSVDNLFLARINMFYLFVKELFITYLYTFSFVLSLDIE